MKTKLLLLLIVAVAFGQALMADMVKEGLSAREQGNYTKAIVLFKKACDRGNAAGCSNLGDMYAEGQGIKHTGV